MQIEKRSDRADWEESSGLNWAYPGSVWTLDHIRSLWASTILSSVIGSASLSSIYLRRDFQVHTEGSVHAFKQFGLFQVGSVQKPLLWCDSGVWHNPFVRQVSKLLYPFPRASNAVILRTQHIETTLQRFSNIHHWGRGSREDVSSSRPVGSRQGTKKEVDYFCVDTHGW